MTLLVLNGTSLINMNLTVVKKKKNERNSYVLQTEVRFYHGTGCLTPADTSACLTIETMDACDTIGNCNR